MSLQAVTQEVTPPGNLQEDDQADARNVPPKRQATCCRPRRRLPAQPARGKRTLDVQVVVVVTPAKSAAVAPAECTARHFCAFLRDSTALRLVRILQTNEHV